MLTMYLCVCGNVVTKFKSILYFCISFHIHYRTFHRCPFFAILCSSFVLLLRFSSLRFLSGQRFMVSAHITTVFLLSLCYVMYLKLTATVNADLGFLNHCSINAPPSLASASTRCCALSILMFSSECLCFFQIRRASGDSGCANNQSIFLILVFNPSVIIHPPWVSYLQYIQPLSFYRGKIQGKSQSVQSPLNLTDDQLF